MARIALRGMRFHAYHGTHPYEREVPQEFQVDIEFAADLAKAERSDALSDTIDYTAISSTVRKVITGMRFNLLESLTRTIAEAVLSEFKDISSIKVRVCKVHTPMNGVGSVEVELSLDRSRM